MRRHHKQIFHQGLPSLETLRDIFDRDTDKIQIQPTKAQTQTQTSSQYCLGCRKNCSLAEPKCLKGKIQANSTKRTAQSNGE
jgi:hypothetical protein